MNLISNNNNTTRLIFLTLSTLLIISCNKSKSNSGDAVTIDAFSADSFITSEYEEVSMDSEEFKNIQIQILDNNKKFKFDVSELNGAENISEQTIYYSFGKLKITSTETLDLNTVDNYKSKLVLNNLIINNQNLLKSKDGIALERKFSVKNYSFDENKSWYYLDYETVNEEVDYSKFYNINLYNRYKAKFDEQKSKYPFLDCNKLSYSYSSLVNETSTESKYYKHKTNVNLFAVVSNEKGDVKCIEEGNEYDIGEFQEHSQTVYNFGNDKLFDHTIKSQFHKKYLKHNYTEKRSTTYLKKEF